MYFHSLINFCTQIIAVLENSSKPLMPKEIVQVIYKVTIRVLHYWSSMHAIMQDVSQPKLLAAAEYSVSLHLHKLRKDSKAKTTGLACVMWAILVLLMLSQF